MPFLSPHVSARRFTAVCHTIRYTEKLITRIRILVFNLLVFDVFLTELLPGLYDRKHIVYLSFRISNNLVKHYSEVQ